MSDNLKEECNDFVHTYADELVEMLIADLNPQEVCVYLKLCSEKSTVRVGMVGGDTSRFYFYFIPVFNFNFLALILPLLDTNVIADDTVNGQSFHDVSDLHANPQCVLCEFVMKQIQDELKDKATEVMFGNLLTVV